MYKRQTLEAVGKGRVVGLHLAGDGCLNELTTRAREWNGKGGLAAYAASSILECSHMSQAFFEDSDKGQAMH